MPTAIAEAPVAERTKQAKPEVAGKTQRVERDVSWIAVQRPTDVLRNPLQERRRPDRSHGLALETLGHAVEYLMDSRMFLETPLDAGAEQEALHILKRMSRVVFAECPQVVSVWARFGRMCRRSFGRR